MTNCPAAPLFTPKDISIQQVNMDTLGKEKEWVAVVNLNTEEKNSYLQSELQYCKVRDYLTFWTFYSQTLLFDLTFSEESFFHAQKCKKIQNIE